MKSTIQNKQTRSRSMLAIIEKSEGKDAVVSIDPYNLSKKPCTVALQLESIVYSVADAPVFPLDGCVEPEQCACVYNLRRVGSRS